MEILNNAELTRRLLLLENAVMAGKSREVNNTYRSENALNKANNLTPTILTKQGYIDDTEVVFNNVPNGNITVYVEDANGSFLNYSIARMTDMITVSFDKPLEYTATITLSIL